tara:strand:- start:914 stop:1936 length:1023 start_codon:yes stop_codon:yes gene_type:complete
LGDRTIKRLLVSILLAVMSILLISFPVLAIANPDSITFGSGTIARYKVFENVNEAGDMLFVAECYVEYAAEPSEAAGEAFTFQVLNVAGDTVLLQRPISDYQDIVVSIYQTAAQVTAAGFVSSAYKLRIAGNPAMFGAPNEGVNMVTATLDAASDWLDQSEFDGINSWLYVLLIAIVENIEAEMSVDHTVEVGGVTYLDASGSTLFLAGIPSLNVFLPEIFQSTSTSMTAEDPASTGALQIATTPTAMLGGNMARSVTGMASFMGVSESTAGIIITSILGFVFLPVIYWRLRNGAITMIAASLFVIACGYFGLFPLAIAFIIAGVILILTAVLFWGKISI